MMLKKIKFSEEQVYRYIEYIVVILLAVLEIIICTQYLVAFGIKGGVLRFAILVACCIILEASCLITAFGLKKFKHKCVFYSINGACLFAISAITGNSWLSSLYCVVLTQAYISSERFRYSVIIFAISCVTFIVSFVSGWLLTNSWTDIYATAVRILGDCVLGLVIFGFHFIVINFTLKFYRTNLRLTKALKEADESRKRLSEANKKISETAVYEERNRIAKDIHDNAGHSITTVIMQTEAAKLLIDSNPEEAKNKILSANIHAKNALEQMRLSVHLLAGRKGEQTLKDEVEEIIAQAIDGTDLKIRANIGDVLVGADVQRFICNSIKECFANGIRHGRATAFYVELKTEGDSVQLLVSDNGVGTATDFKEGFGLSSMRKKAQSFGGRLDLSGEEGEGFEVKITVPNKKEGIYD